MKAPTGSSLFRKSEQMSADGPQPVTRSRPMSPGKLAYEGRRAAEAGLSLEAWLSKKARDAARMAAETVRVPGTPVKTKGKGLLSRLLDRAHKPLG